MKIFFIIQHSVENTWVLPSQRARRSFRFLWLWSQYLTGPHGEFSFTQWILESRGYQSQRRREGRGEALRYVGATAKSTVYHQIMEKCFLTTSYELIIYLRDVTKIEKKIFLGPAQGAQWIQNLLIISSWTHEMKVGGVFRTRGIKEGRERVTNGDQNHNLIKR